MDPVESTEINWEVQPPPKRDDASRQGNSIEAATAEAHDRESRNDAATEREQSEKKLATLPPDDGKGGTWQHDESQSASPVPLKS
jgi:hypothetical protein